MITIDISLHGIYKKYLYYIESHLKKLQDIWSSYRAKENAPLLKSGPMCLALPNKYLTFLENSIYNFRHILEVGIFFFSRLTSFWLFQHLLFQSTILHPDTKYWRCYQSIYEQHLLKWLVAPAPWFRFETLTSVYKCFLFFFFL